MFFLQLLLAFQEGVAIADYYTGIDFPHSTEWLAGVKAIERRAGKYGFDFLAGCTIVEQYYDYDDARPLCSLWYRVLVGKLRLREDPDFLVVTLEMCLIALSGSIFLLIIRSVA